MEIRAGANLGRYQLLAEIGRGAMGMVYQALDPEIDRLVAIKTYSELDTTSIDAAQFRDRFAQEARAAGRLLHPGIVTIYDRGEEPERHIPYIVMEYVAGQPLSALLNNQTSRLEEKYALQIAREVAEALAYAHERGVVHRDIKPSNILITEDGNAKIADFGVARLDTSNMTIHGEVIGTPAYMSPEQLTGGTVDGRSDIFSLGVILYTMLSGFRPFQGNGASTIGFKVINQQPMPITNYHLDLSKDIEYVVARSMAKNPNERYATGTAMAQDLTDILEGRMPRSRRENTLPVNPDVQRVEKDYRPFLAAVMPHASQHPARGKVVPMDAAAAVPKPGESVRATPTALAPVPITPVARQVTASGGKGRIVLLAVLLVGAATVWLVHSSRAQLRANNGLMKTAPQAAAPVASAPKPDAGSSVAARPKAVNEPVVRVSGPSEKAPVRSAELQDSKPQAPSTKPDEAASNLDRTVVFHKQQLPAVANPPVTVAKAAPSAPAAPWHDPLDSKQPATLEFALEHHFKEANISVWIDNKLEFTGISHGEARKRLFLLHGGLEGKESHEVTIPPGEHAIKVRVTSPDGAYDNSGSIESTFLDSHRTILEIHCDKRGIGLKLSDGS